MNIVQNRANWADDDENQQSDNVQDRMNWACRR
jgi:hypothetical protein